MEQTIILNSHKLSKQSVIFLSYLQRQIKKNNKQRYVCINLFEAEEEIGISATDEDLWRAMLLELSSKPINYLSNGDAVIQHWIYRWRLYGGELQVEANKMLLEFTPEDLYILMSHYNYTPAMFKIIGRNAFINTETANIDIDVCKIREACHCIDKYTSFNNFKIKVIDTSIEELSEIFQRKIDYSFLRSGKTVRTIRFTVYKKEVKKL